MIAYLKGEIISLGKQSAVVLANNLGYKVFLPGGGTGRRIGEAVALYIYEYVREDAHDLYGFFKPAELEFFELLLTIAGVGPKSALGIMTVGKLNDLKEAIAAGDPSLLTKVSGIGRKTAERIVLELKEKIDAVYRETDPAGPAAAASDEIDALVALGYTVAEARSALRQVDPAVRGQSARIRSALMKLGRAR